LINAEFFKTDEGYRVVISGHADYAEHGKDVVCGAASGVFYAFCGYIYNFCKEGLRVHAVRDGYADVECGENACEAVKMALLGLWQLAITYPKNVAVHNNAFDWHMNSGRELSA
jgi:uncharacterized protein YsxB (DUF464 family)